MTSGYKATTTQTILSLINYLLPNNVTHVVTAGLTEHFEKCFCKIAAVRNYETKLASSRKHCQLSLMCVAAKFWSEIPESLQSHIFCMWNTAEKCLGNMPVDSLFCVSVPFFCKFFLYNLSRFLMVTPFSLYICMFFTQCFCFSLMLCFVNSFSLETSSIQYLIHANNRADRVVDP